MYYMVGDNLRFERAALKILLLRDPRCCRIMFGDEYSFTAVYAYAIGIASVIHDARILEAIKYRREKDINGAKETNYTGTDEENLKDFFDYFNDCIVAEIKRYDCKNELLLNKLDFSREEQIVRSEEDRQKELDELDKLLRGVHDSYDGFVIGLLNQAHYSNRKCRELIKYLKEYPNADSSDVVYYAEDELGFAQEAHVAELERYDDSERNVNEDAYDCLGKWLCVSNPETGYGLFSKDTWQADELLPILEKYV